MKEVRHVEVALAEQDREAAILTPAQPSWLLAVAPISDAFGWHYGRSLGEISYLFKEDSTGAFCGMFSDGYVQEFKYESGLQTTGNLETAQAHPDST